jgi:serine/threonine protein phosphatase PrpC
LACDGVFDVLDNKHVMKFVLDQVSVRKEITDTVLPEVGDALLRESLNAGSKDNMSVVIAALSKESTGIKTIIQGRTLDFASPEVVQG